MEVKHDPIGRALKMGEEEELEPGVRIFKFQFWFCLFLAVFPWANHLTWFPTQYTKATQATMRYLQDCLRIFKHLETVNRMKLTIYEIPRELLVR